MLSFDNNVATLVEVELYTLSLAILLVVGYVLPHLNIRNIKNKITGYTSKAAEMQDIVLKDVVENFQENLNVAQPLAELSRSYPKTWWWEEKTFQLERRAIFSRTWLFVTHASKFEKPGDYRTFDITGFSFLVILGKDRQLRAFHNVCRHRAYAVAKKECGSSIVLGCRYHGWSYDTKGKLVKAPEFESVEGFEKDLNGLWEIKLVVNDSMVFVNFDARSAVPEIPFKTSMIPPTWKIEKMAWLAEWKMEAQFNWKLGEGHISFQHHSKATKTLWTMMRALWETSQQEVITSHCVTLIKLAGGNILTVRLLPQSRSRTVVESNLYALRRDRSVRTEREIVELKSNMRAKISQLEILQRRILGGKAEPNGSHLEQIQEILVDHLSDEKILGMEIHPAAQKRTFTQTGQDDDDLCKDLEDTLQSEPSFCDIKATGKLEW